MEVDSELVKWKRMWVFEFKFWFLILALSPWISHVNFTKAPVFTGLK